jgi:Protein of unknown function (DUF2934)
MQNSNVIVTNARTVRNPTAEEIAQVAYHLYLEQGSQQGYELDDWLRAEQLLFQQLNEPEAAPSSPVAEAEEDHPSPIQELDTSEQDFAPDHRGLSRWEDIRRSDIPYRPPSRYSPPSHRDSGYFWPASDATRIKLMVDDAESLPAAPDTA